MAVVTIMVNVFLHLVNKVLFVSAQQFSQGLFVRRGWTVVTGVPVCTMENVSIKLTMGLFVHVHWGVVERDVRKVYSEYFS